jgi:hypothetical protein
MQYGGRCVADNDPIAQLGHDRQDQLAMLVGAGSLAKISSRCSSAQVRSAGRSRT